MTGAEAHIEVRRTDDGRWVWSYRSSDTSLLSNRSYPDRGAALGAARLAFPDIPSDRIRVTEVDAPGPRLAHRMVGLLLILVAWRNRRRE